MADKNTNDNENNTIEDLDGVSQAIKAKFEEFKTNISEIQTYKLIFTFDDKEYSTNFKFSNTGFTNGCISINYDEDDDIATMIESNSEVKKCFNPVLTSAGGLPEGVTQTDILQVLMTKLKFIIFHPAEAVSLLDAATKPGITVPISYWRAVRGEVPFYQKYGYYFYPFTVIANYSKTTKWYEIKDETFDETTDKTFDMLVKEINPDIRINDYRDTVESVMKKVGAKYDNKQTEEQSALVKDLFSFIRRRFHRDKQFRFGLPLYTLSRGSGLWPIWIGWDKRLNFVSFDRIVSGGSPVRKSRRKHKSKKKNTRKVR